jgi:hypothetical protein
VSDLVARRVVQPTCPQVARLKVRPRTLHARALRVELKSPIWKEGNSSAAVRTEAFAEDLYTLRQTKDSLAPVYSPGVYWLDRTGGLFGDRREVRSDSDTNNICSKEGRNLDSQIGKIRWVWFDWRCFVPNNTIPPFNEGRSDACKYRGPKALVQSDSSLQACFPLRFKW